MSRVIVFGDDRGVPQILKHLTGGQVVAIVGASIRAHSLEQIAAYAESCGASFLVQPNAQSESYGEFVDTVGSLLPDLFIVNSYSMLIRKNLLRLPRFGGVNLHGSFLPRHRGANPIQWAIIQGDSRVGVSLHELAISVDSGDIIDQIAIPISFSENWLDVTFKTELAVDQLLERNISTLLNGDWKSTPQNESEVTLNRRRGPEDSQFTWDFSIVQISRMIRALVPPMPVAFCKTEDGKIVEFANCLTPWQLYIQRNLYSGRPDPGKDKLVIRALEQSDARWFRFFHPKFANETETDWSSVRQVRGWIAKAQGDRLSSRIFFAVGTQNSENILGLCVLSAIDWNANSAILQIHPHEGDSFRLVDATSILEGLISIATKDLLLRELTYHCWPGDWVTEEACRRMGFKKTSRLADKEVRTSGQDEVIEMEWMFGE